MIIVSQDRTIILNDPKFIGYDYDNDDMLIVAFEGSSSNTFVLGSYEIKNVRLVFEKIIEAFKKGEKVFEMPKVC